jgi:hypothetical protein
VFGTRSLLVGVISIIVFPVLHFALRYTPIVILGPSLHLFVVCSTAILLAGAGFGLGLICWLEASESPVGTEMRSVALWQGRAGAALCGLLVVAYVVLWFWLSAIAQ